MIKCSKLRPFDIEPDKIWYLEKIDTAYADALKGREEGYFMTLEELRECFEAGENFQLSALTSPGFEEWLEHNLEQK